jgi:hypothetical protein
MPLTMTAVRTPRVRGIVVAADEKFRRKSASEVKSEWKERQFMLQSTHSEFLWRIMPITVPINGVAIPPANDY